MRRAGAGITVVLSIVVLAACERAEAERGAAAWSEFGSDKGFTRYSPLDQIDASNVGGLAVAWERPAVDPAILTADPELRVNSYLLSTPQLIDGVLYAANGVGLVEAIDPATGATIWVQPLPEGDRLQGRSNRGVGFWSTGSTHRILHVRGEYLYSLDRATGAPDPAFGDGGRVYLRHEGENALPFSSTTGVTIVGDVAIVAGMRGGAGDRSIDTLRDPGNVMGFDARTGALLWEFSPVPTASDPAAETWGNRSWSGVGDMAAWCCVSADEDLGYVYVPFSSPTGFYGGWRPGDNLYSNSLVAIDARTGERVWHYQLIHHGIWEYEPVGAPVLITINVEGRPIDAVVQANKTGYLFVLDRVTGEPVWPIEERSVPASSVPGEVTSPTQPFPTKPAPVGRIGITEADLMDFTPELHARIVEFLEPFEFATDLYTPSPVIVEGEGKQGMLAVPGSYGAFSWHTGAFDPETGYYFAQAHSLPGVNALTAGTVEQLVDETTIAFPRVGRSPLPGPDGLPLLKPPYGTVTAIDMNTGEHVWTVVNGDGMNEHPLLRELDLPPLGTPSRPSALVTKTLLFLGEGSDSFGGVDIGGRTFRAFDKATGAVLWETELAGGTTSQPMTYMHDGRQYIVVPIGDSGHPASWVALALDE